MRRINSVFKKGFTLLEMLLVLAIASAIFVMLINYSAQRTEQMRLDKATLQIQQILNAAMAFYINNGRWPSLNTSTISSSHELVTGGYLPTPTTTNLQNPWGRAIQLGWANSTSTPSYNAQYYVASITGVSGTSYPGGVSPNARIVSGRLPMGFVTDSPNWTKMFTTNVIPTANTSSCTGPDACSYAVASVTIPGQNLNNARSVNFASIYSSGACVPAPTCPSGMIPQIVVAPVAVAGVYDNTTGSSPYVYPITSFTANAYGGTGGAPVAATTGNFLRGCQSSTLVPCYGTSTGTKVPVGSSYWRVCLSVYTERGLVSPTNQSWGTSMGSILAVTRCTPSSSGTTSIEPSGTSFGVFQN